MVTVKSVMSLLIWLQSILISILTIKFNIAKTIVSWPHKKVVGYISSDDQGDGIRTCVKIQEVTWRRCRSYINPLGIEETLDSLPQVDPPLCVIEDYYVRDSTYIDGDNTKQRNKYENAKRISVEDMIGVSDERKTTNNNFQVLTGPPGSGKTVLAKRIAKLSIKKGLKTWLLNLEDCSEDDHLSVEDLLISSYLGNNANIEETDIDEEYKWYQDHPDRCLIVLDGLDKAMFKLNFLAMNQTLSSKTKLHPSKLFSLLCSGYFLPAVRLVLSSRPHSIVSFPARIRPNRVIFVNDLLEKDVKKMMVAVGDSSDRLYKSLIVRQPRSLPFVRNPLYLFIVTKMCDKEKMNTLQSIPFLFAMLKHYKSTRHDTADMLGKSVDMYVVEKAIAEISWKKTINCHSQIKSSDLSYHKLRPEQVQNVLFPVIENEGIEWLKWTEDMLVLHFAQIRLQELYCVTYLMEKDTFDEFKEAIDQLLVRDSDLRAGNGRLASLLNTLCGYISSPMFQGTDKMRDHYLNVFIEIFIGDIRNVFGKNFQSCKHDMIDVMKNVMEIMDDKIITTVAKKLKQFEFQFEFTDKLDDLGKHHISKMLKTIVTKTKGLRLNCIGYIESEIDELLQCLLAGEKIEHLYLENVDKLSPGTFEGIFKGVLPRVSKVFTLVIHDKHDFETLKRRMDNYDCSRLEYKKLDVELYCPGKQNYKTTLLQTRSFMKPKIQKSKDENTIINSPTGSIELFELIKNEVVNESKKMLEGLKCDIDGSVLPQLKFVDDFSNEEIFKDGDRNVYDMEVYPKSKTVDLDELSNGFNSGGNMSICLSGAKGSGKTIIANRMMLHDYANDQYPTLINLEDFENGDEISLKDVLIDNLAVKYGIYNIHQCEKAFHRMVGNPSKCNIILDNYDRSSFKLTTSSSPDVNGKMKPGELFGNLFAKRLLPEANILLISRPYAITQLPSDLRPKSLYFVGNLSDEDVNTLFNRFCVKESEEKRNYIDQHFPLAWKLCRNPQMLHILVNLEKLDQKRNFFELIDEICFQFYGDDQKSREDYLVMNSNKLKYLAYTASSDSSITLITDAASKNIQAVEGMMLVKPYENKQQTNKSHIQSHFINQLIQDHYTARYLKEGAFDMEVKHFFDENLFPELSKSTNVEANMSERNQLIRRLCCSNKPGRRNINEYFWKRMKEDAQRHCEGKPAQNTSQTEGINMIMDLVEVFAEEKRHQHCTEVGRIDPSKNYGCHSLCKDLKKTTQTFYNVNFRSLRSVYQTCKLTEFCKFEIKNANLSIGDIGKEHFKQMLSAIKTAQLKLYELEIQKVTSLEVSSLKELKLIFQCIHGELKIDIHDPDKAYELHDKFKNLRGLHRIFNQKELDITIYDAAEHRYQPLKISRR